jgi:hypothetical protein
VLEDVNAEDGVEDLIPEQDVRDVHLQRGVGRGNVSGDIVDVR